MARTLFSSIEPLESRIAPAALISSISNPLPDIVAGIGKTGATVDLSNMFDTAHGTYDTLVDFTTNFDTDTATSGVQPGHIVFELFDSKAPLTVQNFLTYIETPVGKANFLDTFFHRSVSGFVLQGGGYDATAISTHIPVGPAVHNEFDPNDASRSNTEGTVAMAKTGISPNSATSEFFINLGDNSSNLDNQNGGFTVFAKVVSGMDVVNAIAALPTADLSSATGISTFNNVPYQGTLPSNGIPNAGELITITGIHVTAPQSGVSPDYTFKVLGVTDHTSHLPTNLLSTSVSLSAGKTLLGLDYKPGAAGIADVTVAVEDSAGNPVLDSNSQPLQDTFQVTVLPNIVADAVSDTLHDVVVQGDSASVKFKLTNTGAGYLHGKVEVKVYMSLVDPLASAPPVLDPSTAMLIGDFVQTANIASGKSAVYSHSVKLPIPDALAANGAQYQLFEQVTSAPGNTITELFSDDNASLNGSQHTKVNIFGNFSSGTDAKGHAIDPRINVPFTYVDSNHHLVTITYTGDGAGLVIPNADGTVSIETGYLGLQGNSNLSSLKFKVANGLATHDVTAATHTPLEGITTFNPIGQIRLGNVDVTGNVDIQESARTIALGNLTGDGLRTFAFHIGGSALAAAVTLGTVTDYNFTADSTIKSLAATGWLNSNASQELISAKGMGSLRIAGNLAADVTVAATVPASTPTVNSFSVGGLLQDSTVQIAGNVGSVVLGAMDSSKFLVGVKSSAVPTQRSDFSGAQKITSFTITGMSGIADMDNSQVSAPSFGSIFLKEGSAHMADSLGFVADTISKYRRGALTLTNLPIGSSDATEDPNYTVQILPFV